MKSGVKAAIGATAVLVLAVGGQLLYLHHERNAPVAVKAPEREVIADDELVFLKKKRPDTLKDIKDLDGSKLWVSAGGQMEFYPYVGHAVQYGKSAGTLRWSRADHREGRGGAGGSQGGDVPGSRRRQAGVAGVYAAGIFRCGEGVCGAGGVSAGWAIYVFYRRDFFLRRSA